MLRSELDFRAAVSRRAVLRAGLAKANWWRTALSHYDHFVLRRVQFRCPPRNEVLHASYFAFRAYHSILCLQCPLPQRPCTAPSVSGFGVLGERTTVVQASNGTCYNAAAYSFPRMSHTEMDNMREYLKSTEFLDFDNESVRDFAARNSIGKDCDIEKAKSLYIAVRDGFRYNPYILDLRREGLKASHLLTRNFGYCVEKAVLLSAAARAVGIPSRLSFYIVKNHIATERLEQILRTDCMVFHGASEMFLNGKWVKSTPAFNRSLCNRIGVEPLEFDGLKDSVFQEFNAKGNVFMTYLHDYGAFADLPYEVYIEELKKHYAHVFCDAKYTNGNQIYDFTKENGLESREENAKLS